MIDSLRNMSTCFMYLFVDDDMFAMDEEVSMKVPDVKFTLNMLCPVHKCVGGPFISEAAMAHHWGNIHHRIYKCKLCMATIRPRGTFSVLREHFEDKHNRSRRALGLSKLQQMTSCINEGAYLRTDLVFFTGVFNCNLLKIRYTYMKTKWKQIFDTTTSSISWTF